MSWSEFGKAFAGGAGDSAGGGFVNAIGEKFGSKVLGIPSPGERALEAMNTMYPGTSPWERLGAGGGQAPSIENTEKQQRTQRKIAYSQRFSEARNRYTQEKVAKVTARGGLAQAIANSGISDPNVLKELMSFVEDGKKPGGNQMFGEDNHPQWKNANTGRIQAQTQQFLSKIEHDKTLQEMMIKARGGEGYGRIIDTIFSRMGINPRELNMNQEYQLFKEFMTENPDSAKELFKGDQPSKDWVYYLLWGATLAIPGGLIAKFVYSTGKWAVAPAARAAGKKAAQKYKQWKMKKGKK